MLWKSKKTQRETHTNLQLKGKQFHFEEFTMHFNELRQNTKKSVCLYLVLILLSDGIGVQFWKMIACMFVWQQPSSSIHATMSKLINTVFDDGDDLIYRLLVASAATTFLPRFGASCQPHG